MGDEYGGIEAEMGNQHGVPAAAVKSKKKKKKKQQQQPRREDVAPDEINNGEASDENADNYRYVSIVSVSSPPSSRYESATDDDEEDDDAIRRRQLIDVNTGDVLKCSVVIGAGPQALSRVSRVSVNGDIPNGSPGSRDTVDDTSLVGSPNGPSSTEKVSSPCNGSASCGYILNGSSTNEESLDSEEISKSDTSRSPSVIHNVRPTNGSSLIEIVSDLSFSSLTKQIPTSVSTNNECEVLKENGISKSDSGVSSLVVDQVTPLGTSSSLIENGLDSFSELPCKTPPTSHVAIGDSRNEAPLDENESLKSDTSGSPLVNGHANGLSSTKESTSPIEQTPNVFSSTNGSTSPVERIPNGSSTPDHRFAEGSPRLPDQNGLFAEDSLEERLARAVRETLDGLPEGVEMTDGLQEEVERVVREKLKRQRSGSSDCWTHDDTDDHCIVDFLDKINDHAEARLAAKRQARAEAREIRMRELERMQRESEDGDRVYDAYPSPVEAVNRCVRASSVTTPRSLLSSNNSYHSSRRSSEDSLEEVNTIRDARHELRELEEKFRKAMIANAQLDNEKAAIQYQVDMFKDRYEELEEQNLQLTREHKETCRQLEQTKRHRNQLKEDLDVSRTQLGELLQLVQEKGLVVVEGDCSSSDEESESSQPRPKKPPKKALVSAEVADVLQQGSGSLDVRLKKFVEERNELLDELRRVKLELEEERAHSRGRTTNGPTGDSEDIQREANKLLGDYKFKMQKAEQDVNTLQANVARLESQVVRYKSAAETSEKLEGELKLEKRKLQRELREAQSRVEELEISHSHLQKRLDKLKNAKSALLKDL